MSRQRLNDDGFTLMELVVTVTIVGIMVTALGGVMISYLKSSNSAQSRLNESTDQQLTSAYWQQDVSSLGLRDFAPGTADQVPELASAREGAAPDGVPPGCGGLSDVVIGFVWNDYPAGNAASSAWNATVNAAVYTSTKVGQQWELTRVRCRTGAATASTVIAHRLTAPPIPTCYDKNKVPVSCASVTPLPATVTLTMSVSDKSAGTSTGYSTILTAQRRQG